jgi:hypothetical protein
MQRIWTKNAFWVVNNKKWRKRCKFFLLSYLITLIAFLCSQWAPNPQIKFFMFDWSIYRLFVLNTGWKSDPVQMNIFVNICSTCIVVELKTRLETWNARNDLNGVYLFHLSYLKLFWLTCAHNGHQLSKSSILCLIGRSKDHLCLIWPGNLLPPNVDILICLLDMQGSRTKKGFETWIERSDLKVVYWFHFSYLINVLANLCS